MWSTIMQLLMVTNTGLGYRGGVGGGGGVAVGSGWGVRVAVPSVYVRGYPGDHRAAFPLPMRIYIDILISPIEPSSPY